MAHLKNFFISRTLDGDWYALRENTDTFVFNRNLKVVLKYMKKMTSIKITKDTNQSELMFKIKLVGKGSYKGYDVELHDGMWYAFGPNGYSLEYYNSLEDIIQQIDERIAFQNTACW